MNLFVYEMRVLLTMCLLLATLTSRSQNGNLPEYDQAPIYFECDHSISATEQKECTKSKIATFLKHNLIYPKRALESDISGTVVLQFEISEVGIPQNVKILYDIGYGCGDAAIAALYDMPKWTPAKKGSQYVSSTHTLPFVFDATNYKLSQYRILWGNCEQKDTISEMDILNNTVVPFKVKTHKHENVDVDFYQIMYHKGKRTINAQHKDFFHDKIQRILKKARSGGQLFLAATIQENGVFTDVVREFEVR